MALLQNERVSVLKVRFPVGVGVAGCFFERKRNSNNYGSEESGSTYALSKSETEFTLYL